MSSIKVSALTAKTTPSGSEELLINDGGTSKKITIANLTKGHDLPTVPSGITTDTNKEYNLKLTDVSGTETLTWIEETDNDTTYSTVTTSVDGLAPTLPATHGSKFLRGDATWVVPTDTNTNQLTTFTVSATTDTTPTTISHGDDLLFTAGTGITCETTADGTVTISNTVTDTDTTYSTATTSTEGLVKIEDGTTQTVAANTATATASRTYGVQLNASDQAVVNVPWTAATGIDDVSGVARATSGLLFNSDTAAANVLDDYEEGTWTPVPLFGGGNGITGSFTGTYVKIGRQVTAKYKLTFTGLGSSTGAFTCTGLPYTTAGSRGNTSGFSYMHRLAQSSYTQIYLYVVSTSIGFEQAGFSSSNASALDNTDFTTSTDFRGSVIYETNS